MPESCLQVDEDVVARNLFVTLTLLGTLRAFLSSLGVSLRAIILNLSESDSNAS